MFIVIYCAILGLLAGSAINAIVWRLHVGKSWVKGRSMCPECKHELAPQDLVPVLSWLWLRGKCRYCKAKIHWQYPVVELVTAGLFAVSAQRLIPASGITNGYGWALLGLWLVLVVLLVILAVYDLRWMLLPDKVMLPAAIVTAAIAVTRAAEAQSWVALRGPVLASLAAGGLFLAIALISRGRGMGGGDIKFAFVMGLLLGLRGTLVAMMIAFDVAALIAVILIAARRRGRRDQIPFGPFLVAGTIIAYWYGGAVVEWYLRVNGLS